MPVDLAADDHDTDYDIGGGSDEDEQLVDGEPRYGLMCH